MVLHGRRYDLRLNSVESENRARAGWILVLYKLELLVTMVLYWTCAGTEKKGDWRGVLRLKIGGGTMD